MISTAGHRRQAGDKHPGFSLIELVVVITIMGAAMAVAVGLSRFGLTGLHLKGSARDVVTSLRYARERSVTQQAVYKVVFQLNDHRWYLADELERFRKTMQLNPDIRFRGVRIDGQDIRNADMTGELHFFPNGSSSRAEIILENRKGAKMKIVTDLLTGAAKIVPPAPGD